MHKLIILACFLLCINYASAQYDPSLGLEYAYTVALAYCNPADIMNWTCGAACKNLTGYQPYYSNLFNLTLNQTLSFTMLYNPSEQKFVTSFRGTVTHLQTLTEIFQDTPVDYDLVSVPNAKVLKYFFDHYKTDLRPTYVEKLQQAYKEFPNYSFVFTGHSLGGALVTIAAFDTVTSGFIPQSKMTVYNYGSPRVGNYAFAQAVNAALPIFYRVTHWMDIGPHIPPCIRNSSGICTPDSSQGETSIYTSILWPALWPAYHVSGQIFYNGANTEYQTCVGNEDPKCADQFELDQTNTAEHYYYVNVHIACDGESDAYVNSREEGIILEFGHMF